MKYVVWAAMAIVTLMILMGSVTELMGNPAATTRFATRGFPALFATFIGVCEIAGAFGIWFRRTSMYAAGGIATIMFSAVYYHLMHTPVAKAIPAFFVLICCGLIVNRRETSIIG